MCVWFTCIFWIIILHRQYVYVHRYPSNARTQRQQRVHAAVLGPRAPEAPAIREEERAAGVQAAAAVAAACRSGLWGGI